MHTTISSQSDRVQRHTAPATAESIEAKTRRNVRNHASHPAEMTRRIGELEREWDVERMLEANASTLALTGAVLGTTVDKKWFLLTGGVLAFLFQHATSGWCPPLPVLRKVGLRTQSEIDQERYALKALRGDFEDGTTGRPDVDETLRAVSETASTEVEQRREPDRVRRHTSRPQLQHIDRQMARRVRLYAAQPAAEIGERIAELTREWSIERYLQINVAVVGLTTAALAAGKDRRWGYATCAALAMFLFHATEGFDPPLPALRRLGVRSRAEINREIYALKVLRGDFDEVLKTNDATDRMEAALNAVGV